jgi:hypothetical protein
MKRKGTDSVQKMMKPTNWYVVVGMSEGRVFSMVAKHGHIAVTHTLQNESALKATLRGLMSYATSLPPFQPVSDQ